MGCRALQFLAFLSFLVLPEMAQGWVSTATSRISVPGPCRGHGLEQRLLRTGADLQAQTRLLQDYFEQCGSALSEPSFGVEDQFVRSTRRKYPYWERSDVVRPFVFRDPWDGTLSRAYLALKPGTKKYPLVVFKCGVFCDLKSPSARQAMELFYDLSPFHLLLVPNVTGKYFQTDNRYFTVGGMDEGRLLYRLARWLGSSDFPHRERVSRLHLVGSSLGGHAALYATLFADHDRQRPLFSSVLVGCPVVDLEPSVEGLGQDTLVGRLFRGVFLRQVFSLIRVVPVWKGLLGPWHSMRDLDREGIGQLMLEGALDRYQYQSHQKGWALPPLESMRVQNEDDFWHLNRFQEVGRPRLKSSVFVWASQDDQVVNTRENAAQLNPGPTRQGVLAKLVTAKGGHCNFDLAYGTEAWAAVYRGLLLSRSPELLARAKTWKVPFPYQRLGRNFVLGPGEIWTDLEFRAVAGSDRIELKAGRKQQPCAQGFRRPRSSCRRRTHSKLSFADLGISSTRIPRSKVEAQALSRWLNNQMKISGAEVGSLGLRENPSTLMFTEYH